MNNTARSNSHNSTAGRPWLKSNAFILFNANTGFKIKKITCGQNSAYKFEFQVVLMQANTI